MTRRDLSEKTILITGAARRIGKALALACAAAGADVIVHHGHSPEEAEQTKTEIESMGRQAWVFSADLEQPAEAMDLIAQSSKARSLYAIVNSASIFEPLSLQETSIADWDRHMAINLSAPFILSKAFAAQLAAGTRGRIVNILDWRALRPGADHFPYTISKAALAALTRAMAIALAPDVAVNALALGAILPPSDRAAGPEVIKQVPAATWGKVEDVAAALIFLLTGPEYITGEIIHVDGGRHLT